MVSSTIFAKAVASKIFEIYAPALFVRRVGSKIVLGPGGPPADSSDVLLDLNRQIANMMGIPRITLIYGAAFGNSREFTAKQKAKSQQ